jgi:hypothetical protein
MPCFTLAMEPWASIWPEVNTLGTKHFEEVDGGVEPRRKFKIDTRLMEMMCNAGALKIIVAREAGKIIGYFTWQITPDVESAGLLIAQQGAWYVEPGYPKAAFALFKRSVKELKALGVQCIFPHHRVQGRGAHLGRFFQKQGAKEIQHTYVMWIGEGANA